jgi:hypothetical protein
MPLFSKSDRSLSSKVRRDSRNSKRRRGLSIYMRKDGIKRLMESGLFTIPMQSRLRRIIAPNLIGNLLIKRTMYWNK